MQPMTPDDTITAAVAAGWEGLFVHCAQCRVMRDISWAEIDPRHHARSLADVAGRLRCHRCGEKPAGVEMHRGSSGRSVHTSSRADRVRIIGGQGEG